jgi:glycosyltransferase involved in cell wall biosynthesis
MSQSGISVIITAYNRKGFVKNAIFSLLEQTLKRSMFEVIVVTNFKVELGEIPSDFQLSIINIDGTIGEFLYNGFLAAKFDLIVFLDDDDTFDPDKLRRVKEVFSRHTRLCYFHNSMKYVDINLRPIKFVRLVEDKKYLDMIKDIVFSATSNSNIIREALLFRGDFNLSSISIRKKCFLPYLSLLRRIVSCQDGFFFFTGLLSMGDLMVSKDKLTNYMVHNSNISGSKNFGNKVSEEVREIRTYDMIYDFIVKSAIPTKLKHNLGNWVLLYKLEYSLMSLVFGSASRLLILKYFVKLLVIESKFSNTLKRRILVFAIVGVISNRLAKKIYIIVNH